MLIGKAFPRADKGKRERLIGQRSGRASGGLGTEGPKYPERRGKEESLVLRVGVKAGD